MKQLIFLSLFVFLISCGDDENETNNQTCIDTEYELEFNIQLNEVVCFPDGSSFEVITIQDLFCCCFCHCISAGELLVTVETIDPTGKKDLFTFGSVSYVGVDNIFDGFIISEFDYLYNGEPDSLPLCEGFLDADKLELIMRISAE